MAEHEQIWTIYPGDGPLIATAIHDGHDARAEVASLFALRDEQRLREEDPYTESFTHVAPTRVIGTRSRFEVDLNRQREGSVYIRPEQAWGLNVWKSAPPQDLIDRSLAEYDAFYNSMHDLFEGVRQQHGSFVVFDIHSYNHRRNGIDAPVDSPEENPVVNIGTGMLDRDRWAGLVDRFIEGMRLAGGKHSPLDVRENVKFKGGNLARWTHETFGSAACVLSIEFKKVFMDEWTGVLDPHKRDSLHAALAATVPGVLEDLKRL